MYEEDSNSSISTAIHATAAQMDKTVLLTLRFIPLRTNLYNRCVTSRNGVNCKE